MTRKGRSAPALALITGVLAVSWASVFVRLADAPSLVIASYRLALSALVLVPVAFLRLKRPELHRMAGSWRAFVLGGMFLALHFSCWIASLEYTSVASSVVIVTANPALVAVYGAVILGERLHRARWAGIVAAFAGTLLIAGGDFRASGRAVAGDGLAFLGAVGVAGYYIVGKSLRATFGTLEYVAAVYSLGALFLLAVVLATRQPMLGYELETYGFLILLALVPQVVGHTLLNWALRYFTATLVASAILGEPVGASLLAYLLLGEIPPATSLAGAAFIGLGLVLVARTEPHDSGSL